MEVSVPLYPFIEFAKRLVNVSAISSNLARVTEIVRESICDFQLNYTNYQFKSSRLHKKFKESVVGKSVYFNDLQEYVEKKLKVLAGDLATDIRKYFVETHTSPTPPRVGIHLVGEDGEVIDVIKLPKSNRGMSKKLEEYSLFCHILEEGTAYIDNHIPKKILKNRSYKHGGLDLDKIRGNYKLRYRDCKVFSRLWRKHVKKNTQKDDNWNKLCCGTNGDDKMFYKSHLAVPVTYKYHAERAKLDEELIDILHISDSGRAILGFLVVDHPETFYFDNDPAESFLNIDVNIMYLFADMLSLILVTKLMYTDGSETVIKYHKEKTSE